jgi:hypothetical protein
MSKTLVEISEPTSQIRNSVPNMPIENQNLPRGLAWLNATLQDNVRRGQLPANNLNLIAKWPDEILKSEDVTLKTNTRFYI